MSCAASIASATSSSASGSKIKFKEVDFIEQIVKSKAPTKRRQNRMDEQEAEVKVPESDLVDIDEVEESLNDVSDGSLSQPSPQRLRNKAACNQGKEKTPIVNVEARSQRIITRSQTRVNVSRNVKRATHTLSKRGVWESSGQVQRKVSLEEEANTLERRGDDGGEEGEKKEERKEAGEETGEEDGKEDGDRVENDAEEANVVDEDEDEDEEEVNISILQVEDEADELVSSASTTLLMSQRRSTPLRERLRPRIKNGTLTLDDSDVEDGGEEDEGETTCSEEREVADEVWVNGEESMDVDETTAAKPRKLKTDRIVDENEIAEEDIGEEDSETEEEEEVGGDTDSEIDVDADGETNKAMEEEGVYAFGASSFACELMSVQVDLAVATAKTLCRLRRDDLVRLCEMRNLKPMGTKHQLAQALLQWQDRQANEPSSIPIIGTVQPPSSTRRRRCKATNSIIETATAVLLRSEHTHQDEPRTPVPNGDKETDPDLELDLESLGLENREIPLEKLVKLEKIGSGGFKDVFIGKFRGRRVAISEFRGTLSASELATFLAVGCI